MTEFSITIITVSNTVSKSQSKRLSFLTLSPIRMLLMGRSHGGYIPSIGERAGDFRRRNCDGVRPVTDLNRALRCAVLE